MNDLPPSRPASDTDKPTSLTSRRDFLSTSGKVVAKAGSPQAYSPQTAR